MLAPDPLPLPDEEEARMQAAARMWQSPNRFGCSRRCRVTKRESRENVEMKKMEPV